MSWSPLDHIYALIGRRCRTQTALGKLTGRRYRVTQFSWIGDAWHKVFSSNLGKALTVLGNTKEW